MCTIHIVINIKGADIQDTRQTAFSAKGSKQQIKRAIIMHSKSQHKSQMPTDEVEYALRDLTANAYRLLTYYYSKSTGWTFHDDKIANVLGVTLRTYKDLRKELTDKGYLLIINNKPPMYFIICICVFLIVLVNR